MNFKFVLLAVFVASLGVSAGCGNSRATVIGGLLVDGKGNIVLGNTVPFADPRRAVPATPVVAGVAAGQRIAPEADPVYCWDKGGDRGGDLPIAPHARFVFKFYLYLKSVVEEARGRAFCLVQIRDDLIAFKERDDTTICAVITGMQAFVDAILADEIESKLIAGSQHMATLLAQIQEAQDRG